MLLSYQKYFQLYLKRLKSLRVFYYQLRNSNINGTVLRAYLNFELVPFQFSIFLKSGGFKYFSLFFDPYIYEGVCVSYKRRAFGSSIALRLVDDGVVFDRSILLFSPVLINLQVVYRPNFFYPETRPRHSTFYFLTAQSQKKLISRLFY